MTSTMISPFCSPQRDTSYNFTSTASSCRAPTSLPSKTIMFLICSVGIWPEGISWHSIVAVRPLYDLPFNGYRLHDDRHFSWEQGQDGTGKSIMGPIWNRRLLGVVKICLWGTLGMKGSTSSCTWPVLLTPYVTLTWMLLLASLFLTMAMSMMAITSAERWLSILMQGSILLWHPSTIWTLFSPLIPLSTA